MGGYQGYSMRLDGQEEIEGTRTEPVGVEEDKRTILLVSGYPDLSIWIQDHDGEDVADIKLDREKARKLRNALNAYLGD